MPNDFKKAKLPAHTLHEGRDRNTWPEQLYRYVQHYFWEPQHLIRTTHAAWEAGKRGETTEEAFYRLIRTQEVPLNFALNLVLRVAPASVRTAFLQQFRFDDSHLPSGSPELLYAADQPFTQPDVLLKTKSQRFFVELKVTGSGSTEQVDKYIRLHAYLNSMESPLEPHLYFLTSGPIERAWKPKTDRALLLRDGLQTFVRNALKRHRPSVQQPSEGTGPSSEDAYASIVNSLQVGHTTWQAIGDCLQRERDRRLSKGCEIAEVMRTLLSDFLVDLRARDLWEP